MPDIKQGPNRVVDGVFEEAGRPVPPAESRALSDRAIPPLDKGAAGGQMLVGVNTEPRFGSTSSSAANTGKRQAQKILWAEVRKQTGRSKKSGASLRMSAAVKRFWAFFRLRVWDEFGWGLESAEEDVTS